ncbi:MAG: 3-oxoacyl-[acyl-carrier protein] reductase [uncultured Solirubrobacterales bacterium]|uniref:3-oxoacyl-[acyl-carrier protein] reductase n=1 Tax=uncultured Solirubrobacterales bacterium TaxID=768556 RepID=A0A6J4SDE1_9ACTN|nr:MAG: 3-oxoacyl-[acyl-carrier protein] reductase [uncultured Solirubrobacterales bacterium]
MRTAVVTGGGRGLGLAIAQRLAARGLAVLVTDLDAEAADRAARSLGTPAWSAGLDVRDPEACRAVAREAGTRGELSVWVNNAGVLFSGRAWELSDAEVELTVAVNLMGVVYGSRAALERMADGGRILNVASLSALGLAPGLAVYAASKHAVLAFGTSLAADLHVAGRRIEVRTLCPDVIDTQMVRDQIDTPEAAILWSGPAPLAVDDVADRALALLASRRQRAVVPAWRGELLRLLYRFPRFALPALSVLAGLGRGRRDRWRRQAGA